MRVAAAGTAAVAAMDWRETAQPVLQPKLEFALPVTAFGIPATRVFATALTSYEAVGPTLHCWSASTNKIDGQDGQNNAVVRVESVVIAAATDPLSMPGLACEDR